MEEAALPAVTAVTLGLLGPLMDRCKHLSGGLEFVLSFAKGRVSLF